MSSSTTDNKSLLLKGIILLYRESLLGDRSENSAEYVARIVKDTSSPDLIIGRSIESEVTSRLKTIAGFMAENPVNYDYDKDTVKNDVMLACAADDSLAPIVEDAFKDIESDEKLKISILNMRQSFKQHFTELDVKKILTQASIKFSNERDSIPNVKNFITELLGKLETFTVTQAEKDPAINYALYLNDTDATKVLVERVQLQDDGTHILQTGWQGMNRMLDLGFRPSEQVVVGAQEHNWKTGFTLSLFRQLAEYNDALCIRDPKKKPALVRFSFEDSAEANLEFLYKSMWENETGQVLESIPKDAQEVASYISERLKKRGWHTFIYDVDPSRWTYKDICNEILRLESKGYEVRVCMLDYLLKIPTTGCIQGPHGVDIRNLYEVIKGFMAARKITMITPHQLSPDAKTKAREGTNDFVKEMVGGGYYSGTKQLAQVIDLEIFINVEMDPRGNYYLAIQRGKHRKNRQTPIEYRHIALQFVKGGIIPDDLGKSDSTRLKVGGETLGALSSATADDFSF